MGLSDSDGELVQRGIVRVLYTLRGRCEPEDHYGDQAKSKNDRYVPQ